jgi:hypothetical protein
LTADGAEQDNASAGLRQSTSPSGVLVKRTINRQTATAAADISNAGNFWPLQKKFPVISASPVKKYDPSPRIPCINQGRRRPKQQQPAESGSVHSFLCSFCIPRTARLVTFLAHSRGNTSAPHQRLKQSPDYRVCPSSHERPTARTRNVLVAATASQQHNSTNGYIESCLKVCKSGSYPGTEVELCSGMQSQTYRRISTN